MPSANCQLPSWPPLVPGEQSSRLAAYRQRALACQSRLPTGGASGPQNQNFSALDGDPLLQGTNDSCRIGVKAVELAILPADRCVTGADLGGVSVGVVEIFQDRPLVRHSNAEAMDGNLAHAVEQILKRFRVQGEINTVHVLAPHGGVHDNWRQRMTDRVARHAINAGC